MALCNVTGTVYLLNGELAQSRVVIFERDTKRIQAEYLGATIPQPVISKTDKQGQIDVNLVTGVYQIKAVGPYGGYIGNCVVPDDASAQLEDIIDVAALPETPPVWLSQVTDARDQAVDAADRADDAADQVVGMVDDIDYAVATAEEAKLPPFTPFSSRAQAEAASIPSSVQYINVAGLQYVRDPSGTALETAGGVKWSPLGNVAVEQFPSADAAVTYAIAADRLVVGVDDDVTLADGAGRSNVILRGDGSVSGSNTNSPSYRRSVVPKNAPTARAMPDRWLLADHWTREATVRVVVLGDSLTTYGADALTAQDGLTLHLERVLRRTNPGRQIEVISRGIGAQRYVDIDSLPDVSYPIANRYPWYDDDQRPWLDYVADLNPHIVVLSSGMNDQAAFDRAAFESVVAKINAMASKPQIVIATNMAPNLAPSASQASFGTYSGQEGRDYVAGYLRTYADYHGYSLIDLNRTFGIVRDGRDILDTYFEAREEEVFGSASRYLAPADAACRDFTFRGQIAAEAWTNPQAMSITISPAANGVVWVVNSGGFLRFRFYRGGAGSLYREVTSTIPTPTAVVSVEITVRGSLFSFRIVPPAAGADAGAQPFTATVIRHGGLFRPDLQYFNGGGAGPVLSATLGVGRERLYTPAITDLELWGDTSGSAARSATGGNGANHPTSLGASAIYGMHFSTQNYHLLRRDPYGLDEIIMARLDGTGSHGAYNPVPGERLWPANAGGGVPASQPAQLNGTIWEALGPVIGSTDAGRTTLWRRVR